MEIKGEPSHEFTEKQWEKVDLVKPLYKPDSCKETPATGYVIGLITGLPGQDKPWDAFVMRLTEPTKATIRDEETREDVVSIYEPGTVILVPQTAKLRGLVPMARNPEFILEVKIQPIKRNPAVKGKPWVYDIGVNKHSIKRRDKYDAMHSAALPQLQAGAEDKEDPPF